MERIKIRKARKEDAHAIAQIVMIALHDDGCMKLAGSKERLPKLEEVFRQLGEAENAQYSYTNALIAEAENGEIAGGIVAYDGAQLHDLRQTFVNVANSLLELGLREEDMDNETDSSEIYLDSLAVFEPYRGQRLASCLIDAAIETYRPAGKPFGLLCEPGNENAYALYKRLGFTDIGERRFAGIPMRHMQRRITQ